MLIGASFTTLYLVSLLVGFTLLIGFFLGVGATLALEFWIFVKFIKEDASPTPPVLKESTDLTSELPNTPKTPETPQADEVPSAATDREETIAKHLRDLNDETTNVLRSGSLKENPHLYQTTTNSQEFDMEAELQLTKEFCDKIENRKCQILGFAKFFIEVFTTVEKVEGKTMLDKACTKGKGLMKSKSSFIFTKSQEWTEVKHMLASLNRYHKDAGLFFHNGVTTTFRVFFDGSKETIDTEQLSLSKMNLKR